MWQNWGERLYDVYCSPTWGGNVDILAWLPQSSHDLRLYMQEMIKMMKVLYHHSALSTPPSVIDTKALEVNTSKLKLPGADVCVIIFFSSSWPFSVSQLQKCLDVVVDLWWFQIIDLMGKKGFVSVVARQNGGKWEIQLPSTHACPSSLN